jgi:hypothetical protein
MAERFDAAGTRQPVLATTAVASTGSRSVAGTTVGKLHCRRERVTPSATWPFRVE